MVAGSADSASRAQSWVEGHRGGRERRQFFRMNVEVPATLFLRASDDLRRDCRIVNLSGGGCVVHLYSLEPIPDDVTHHIRFELPNRPLPLDFDCRLISAREAELEIAQELRFEFAAPRRGNQDAVIAYLQNRKQFERTSFRVAMPVALEAQTGLRQFVPYRGETTEVGKDYAICELTKFGLTVSSEVVATFRGPKFRDEIFFSALVTKVDRGMRGGYRVRVLFEQSGDAMVEFIRRHYHGKAKPIAEPD
ncbi:MAG: PilZ domain-containing protein [Chloroflexota bacterium]|nr:PilZ domain-containing protein [Chloroflexota bacterium]